jgi:type II secretory pathway component PulK
VKRPRFRGLAELLVEIGAVMVVPMMMMAMHDYHNLSLRRIGHCKARQEY